MYFDDFVGRLKKGDEPRMVLLFGDSEGVIAEGYRMLRDWFKKTKPGGSAQVFEGNDHPLTAVLAAAQTASLFASSQLLVLKHAEKALGGRSEEALQLLKDYQSNPNPESCLVFLAEGMKKTAKAVASVERMGWAVQCSDIPEWKIQNWVKEQAQSRGLVVREDAVQLLIQKIGTDMAYLQRALEQLSVYVHPRKAATLEEVRELPVPGFESEIFPFLDQVGLRQTEKALVMMAQLQDGVDAGTVVLLYGRVRELLLIALGRARGWSQPLVAEKLGLHPFRLKNLWDQAGQFSVAELKKALRDLIHLQAGIVTGRLTKETAAVSLEAWVLKWGKRRTVAGGR